MANLVKNINFKQPKYLLPAILYLPLLVAGYLIIDVFDVEIAEEKDNELQTTEYLNADLPAAQLKDGIGGKRDNVERTFGNIRDFSALDGIDNDIDSVKKKEDFDSRYTDQDLEDLAKNDSTEARLADLRKRLNESAKRGRDLSSADFVKDLTPEERAKIEELRRKGLLDELDKDLTDIRSRGMAQAKDATFSGGAAGVSATAQDSIPADSQPKAVTTTNKKVVSELDDDADNLSVVKKVTEESSYFNTLSVNEKESSMIKAIIDEEIKAVDGSRVRLRLLDDIETDDVLIKKGKYLYCTMSGFGSQRVKGKVESVMVDDELYKISLSIYDTDGLEGLYVPESSFRETVKDVGGQALQGNMTVNDGMNTSSSFTSWAANAIQQGYQRVSQAVSKNIKKNKARLKYGTHVYLVNSKKQKKQGGSRDSQGSAAGNMQSHQQEQGLGLYGSPNRSRYLGGSNYGPRQ